MGPGRWVCRWAAARPRAVRAASLRLGASTRSPAWPQRLNPRRPVVLRWRQALDCWGLPAELAHNTGITISPTGTAARPSVPSGALHTSGAWTLMLLGACHGVKPDRRNPADSALVWGRAERELHAELGELPVSWLSLLFGVHYMGRCAA